MFYYFLENQSGTLKKKKKNCLSLEAETGSHWLSYISETDPQGSLKSGQNIIKKPHTNHNVSLDVKQLIKLV